jgi:Holliday junction resolvase RusA-like endonuclease
VSLLISVRVDGAPGPKGSINAFCVRCAQKRLPQKVVIKEESEVGILFRKLIKRMVVALLHKGKVKEKYTGAVETVVTFYIERHKVIKNGVETDEWWPSHSGPLPIHQQSGDTEKHVRTLHDALQDAGLFLNDSQVTDVRARKRWADADNPPGAVIEVHEVIL